MDTTTVPPLASIGIDIGKEVFHIVGFSTDGRIAFPSRPRPASRSNRPDTYQRLPLSTHNLSCETQPVHTFGSKAVIR